MVDSGQLTLSVVICAYTLDRWDDIVRAIDSVRSQSRAPAEVILVCDGNQLLLERARGRWPDVSVVANVGSPGLSGARNTGVKNCAGEVVAFLDDDAAAEPGWAEELLKPYEHDTGVIGVGGRVVPDWRAPRPRWFPDEFLWVVGCSYTGQPVGPAEVRNGIGANMSFRRDIFERAGNFDATVGRVGADAAGCEETEFSIRARRSSPGGRIVLAPSAVCRHAVTSDRCTRSYFRLRCRAEGRSKALVSALTGAGDALASERSYVRSVLPRGVAKGVVRSAHGDPYGMAKSWAIVEGLALTASAYLWTSINARSASVSV